MSEYQYYEFRAIDKPLDREAMRKLRTITSRAEITSTSLINEYHFGDFKGNVDQLMAKFFDGFLYFANWGTHRLCLRVPLPFLFQVEAEAYCVDSRIIATETKEHLIFEFWSPEDCYEEEWEDWRLDRLLPLRANLLAGDLRMLYLAWLSSVQYGDVDDEEVEPEVPPGLQDLSEPLRDFQAFMYLGQDLLAIAAEASGASPAEPSEGEMAAWLTTLTEKEKTAALLRSLRGESSRMANELRARFLGSRKPNTKGSDGRQRRTAGFLRKAFKERARMEEQKRAEKTAREKQKREREIAAARAKYLASLAGREAEIWSKVDRLIATKQPKNYDEAVALLKDLHELSRQGTGAEFLSELLRLRDRHSAKPSFLRRLNEAKLIGSGVERAVKKM